MKTEYGLQTNDPGESNHSQNCEAICFPHSGRNWELSQQGEEPTRFSLPSLRRTAEGYNKFKGKCKQREKSNRSSQASRNQAFSKKGNIGTSSLPQTLEPVDPDCSLHKQTTLDQAVETVINQPVVKVRKLVRQKALDADRVYEQNKRVAYVRSNTITDAMPVRKVKVDKIVRLLRHLNVHAEPGGKLVPRFPATTTRSYVPSAYSVNTSSHSPHESHISTQQGNYPNQVIGDVFATIDHTLRCSYVARPNVQAYACKNRMVKQPIALTSKSRRAHVNDYRTNLQIRSLRLRTSLQHPLQKLMESYRGKSINIVGLVQDENYIDRLKSFTSTNSPSHEHSINRIGKHRPNVNVKRINIIVSNSAYNCMLPV